MYLTSHFLNLNLLLFCRFLLMFYKEEGKEGTDLHPLKYAN